MQFLSSQSPLILLLALSLLIGCQPEPSVTVAKAEPEVTLSPEELEKASWPKEIREEIYGDPEIFSTPRIQFIARIDGEERYTLWSMRLDGSDRRRVADEKFLYGGAAEEIHNLPVRSPNNRYVAIVMFNDQDGFYRTVLDLKEKKRIRVMDGAGAPNLNWTSDSENLIFHTDHKIYNFHVPTQTLTEHTDIHTLEFFLLPDDKTLLAMQRDGYWLYDLAGGIINKFQVDISPNKRIMDPVVSPSGEILAFVSTSGPSGRLHWIDIATGRVLGNRPTKETIGQRRPFFSDRPITFWHSYSDYTYFYNLDNRSVDKVETQEDKIWGMDGMINPSLINYQTSEHYKEEARVK